MADNIYNNMNYLNKDFLAIYKEALEAIRKLSNKWCVDEDCPESDPIIILLKEMAGIADKCNYNTDKNLLESFPQTVQQNVNARLLFESICKMNWYRGATGTLYIKNTGESSISIPAFSMFSNSDNSKIFTCSMPFAKTIEAGKYETFDITQGTITDYSIGGSTTVTIDRIENNKLYFEDYAVAQNGIFVYDADYLALNESVANKSSLSQWKMVDNIYTETSGTKCFELNIDIITGMPYLLFPQWLPDIIENGIVIKYIVTDGSDGNIGSRLIDTYYKSDAELDSTYLSITNPYAITNGYDPDTISEGYVNYKKSVNICKTLVTLTDYINSIYLADEPMLVSNCIVSDKTTDIETAYKIGNTIISDPTLSSSAMTCYDLKFYGLTPYENPTTMTEYMYTFEPMNSDSIPESVYNYISDSKSIQHNFVSNKIPNKIQYIMNNYSLTIQLSYKYALLESQIEEVKSLVNKALIKNFNARKVNFGEKVTYDEVIDVIINADSRIQNAMVKGLDDKDFTSYGIYWTPYEYVTNIFTTTPTSAQAEPLTVGTMGAVIDSTQPLYYGTPVYKAYEVYLTGSGKAWREIGTFTHATDVKVATTNYIKVPITDKWNWSSLTGCPAGTTTNWYAVATPNIDKVYEENLAYMHKLSAALYRLVQGTQSLSAADSSAVYWALVGANKTYYYNGSQITVTNVTSGQPEIKLLSEPVKFTGTIPDFANGVWYILRDKQHVYFFKNNGYYTKINVCSIMHKALDSAGTFLALKLSENDYETLLDKNLSGDSLVNTLKREIIAKSILAYKSPINQEVTNEFELNVKDIDSTTIYDVRYISPNLKITFNTNTSGGGDNAVNYTLRENEAVQIIQPELTDVEEYTYYIYIGYYKQGDTTASLRLSKDVNYTLRQNEYLFAYYRTSDDVNYSYARYGEGSIICSSTTKTFTLNADINVWQSLLTQGAAKGITSDYITSQIAYHTQTTHFNLGLVNGSDTLTIKRLDETDVSDSLVTLSFVRNNEDNELFPAYDNTSGATDIYQTIILDENESVTFVTEGVALESGSMLRRKVLAHTTAPLIKADIGSSITLSAGNNISFCTTSITQIAKGASIKYENILTVTEGSVTYTLPSSGIAYALNSTATRFVTTGSIASTTVTLEVKTMMVEKARAIGLDSHFYYVGYFTDGTNQKTAYLPCTYSNGAVYMLSNTFTLMPDPSLVTVKYTTEEGGELIVLSGAYPERIFIRSILGTDTDRETPITLSAGPDELETKIAIQSIELLDSEYNKLYTATVGDTLRSSKEVRTAGGNNLNIAYVNDEVNYYVYKRLTSATDLSEIGGYEDVTIPSSTNYINVTLTKSGGSTTANGSVPITTLTWAEAYVLKIGFIASTFDSAADKGLRAYIPDAEGTLVPITDIYGNENLWSTSGNNYIKFSPSATVTTITFKGYLADQTATSTLIQVYENVTPFIPLYTPATTVALLTDMRYLDTNSIYDITKTITEEDLIKNPLAAISFLDKRHPFNKVTICKMELEASFT